MSILPSFFEYLGTTEEELTTLVNTKAMYYVNYSIKKSDGKRVRYINAPKGRYKELLESVLYKFLYLARPHKIAHGFVKGKSPKTNAQEHLGAKTIVKCDIHNFFNSIKVDKVTALFYKLGLNPKFNNIKYKAVSTQNLSLLAQFVTLYNQLPQGAPTSPAISNLIMYSADKVLEKLASSHSCVVTRYADDITFSSSTFLGPKETRILIDNTSQIASSVGLSLQKQKTKKRTCRNRLTVTGIVVNSTLNMDTKKYKVLRAIVNNHVTGTKVLTESELQSLRGKLAWLEYINPNKGKSLKMKLLSCPPSQP